MRIISNFHDYYDSFSDKESYTIFNRHLQEYSGRTIKERLPVIETPMSKYFKKHAYLKENQTLSFLQPYFNKKIDYPFANVYAFHVLVGKKVYAGILTYKVKEGNSFLYTVEEVMQVFEKYPQLLKTYDLKKATIKQIEEEVVEFFKPTIKEEHAIDLCRHYNSPILLTYKNRWKSYTLLCINPCLKEYNFQRVLDPFTVYQEISQFYETFLVTEKEVPVQINDKDKIRQHGFDLKTSFRNM